jgi:hypothetical protein
LAAGTVGRHLGHERTRPVLQAERFGERRRDILDAHAEIAAHDLAVLHEAFRDLADEVGGDGEADALKPPERLRMAVLMPMTRPSTSISAPPELPGLMAASVWMKFS